MSGSRSTPLTQPTCIEAKATSRLKAGGWIGAPRTCRGHRVVPGLRAVAVLHARAETRRHLHVEQWRVGDPGDRRACLVVGAPEHGVHHPAAGYVAFFTIALFLLTLSALPVRATRRRHALEAPVTSSRIDELTD